MPRFKVMVTRTAYALTEIEVEAENKVDAEEKTLQEAKNKVFSESSAEYEIEFIEEVEQEAENHQPLL